MIRGNTVGSTALRANFHQQDPKKADYIMGREDVTKHVFTLSDTVPEKGPVLWFNTAHGGAVNAAALLDLEEDETGCAVQLDVEGEIYGVGNAGVNQGAAAGRYDFTVL